MKFNFTFEDKGVFLSRIFSLIIVLIILLPSAILAQNISEIDFKNIKTDDLTEQQIIQLSNRMQEQGLSFSELETVALARGMSSIEISKLINRLSQVSNRTNNTSSQQTSGSRNRSGLIMSGTRTVNNDTLGLLFDELKLPIFGSNIFNNESISFAPSLNIPTPNNYELGTGDELIIDIWGAAEQTYRLTISPEGEIQIPNLGPIFLSGMSIEKATETILNRLSSIYSGLNNDDQDTFAQVSLGNLRSIQVNILGEINAPGTYTLTSFASVFNALYVAGGPNDNGTYRSIKIIRDQEIIMEVDLYNFLVNGDTSENITLQDQDIIKVDPYVNRITLTGESKRQGYFETVKGESFNDLLKFSGGFNEYAFTKKITIERNTSVEKRIVDLNYPEESSLELVNGDIVHIGKILDRYTNKIEIEGAVYRPGVYQLENNISLYSLIQNAEGLMGDAFLDRAVIYRERPDYFIEVISVNLRDLLSNPDELDINLQKNDKVKISSLFDLQEEQSITISGAVLNPNTYNYVENLKLKDLIFEAGGFTDDAAPYNIQIARRIPDNQPNSVSNQVSEVINVSIENGLGYDSDSSEVFLEPFDQVFVRKSPSYEIQMKVTIQGEVLFPGTYALSTRDFRLSDLIEKSGGTTQYAFLEGASLERRFKSQRLDLQVNLADSVIQENDNLESLSKVGIDLREAIQSKNSSSNILLLEGDIITIPKKLETVQIRGEVLYPINVRFEDKKNFRDYISSAGGFTDDSNKKRAYIVYANGEVDKTKKFLFFRSYPSVRPGSVLIIPPKKEKVGMSTTERITLYSTIVSMAAIVTNTIFQITR